MKRERVISRGDPEDSKKCQSHKFFPMTLKLLKSFATYLMKEKLRLVQPVLFSSTCLPGELPPSTGGTCDSHRGRRAVSLRMSLEKHVGDNDGASEGRGREREKRRERRSLRAFGGLLSSSTAANSIAVHMCKHLRYLLV